MGPFTHIEGITFSIVPKKAPGEYQPIHHYSFTKGGSVNDAISEHLWLVRYVSFHQAVRMIQHCGPGAELVKCDIKSALLLLPMHPDNFDLFLSMSFYIWAGPSL